MEQLIKTLPTILRAGGYSTEVVEAAAIAAWKHLAGDNLSNQAVATKLTGKTLVIAIATRSGRNNSSPSPGNCCFA